MAVITLTTDMGLKDHYDAAVKAVILRECPEVQVVDISHSVPPFDITRASFVLKNVFREFPEGSVHIIGVNPHREEGRKHLIGRADGHYFIAADNGIFSLLFEEGPDELVQLSDEISEKDRTFPTKGVFASVACQLVQGKEMDSFGEATSEHLEKSLFRPVVDENVVRGSILYFDSYDNAITNISRGLFDEVGKGRDFTLRFRGAPEEIRRVSDHYGDAPEGEKVALFGSSGYLEIAINKGAPGTGEGARKLFGLKLDDSVQIEFHDRSDR